MAAIGAISRRFSWFTLALLWKMKRIAEILEPVIVL
jgi:hypothetical protein